MQPLGEKAARQSALGTPVSSDLREALKQLADRIVAAAPGTTLARQKYVLIDSILKELSDDDRLEFFTLCKVESHPLSSAALLITQERIFASRIMDSEGFTPKLNSWKRASRPLDLRGRAGSDQVLDLGEVRLVLDTSQSSDFRRSIVPSMPQRLGEPPAGQARKTDSSRTSPTSAKLFVSHATEDGSAAKELVTGLEDRGAPTWLATRDIQVGENYAAQIYNAIVECSHLVVLLSPAAVASVHVQREVNLALDHGKHLLPVVVAADADFMFTLPAQWKYWLGVVQVVPYSSAADAVEVLLRSIGARA